MQSHSPDALNMWIHVVGSAAGGGFPQWNCNTPFCRLAYGLDVKTKRRSQSSLAVTADRVGYALFNCSPDLRQQIIDTPVLHPKDGLRSTPIKAVVLTNADVDHIAGLLTMREGQSFVLYATDRVAQVIAENSIFNVLNPKFVQRRLLDLDVSTTLSDAYGNDLGMTVEAFAVPGKVALFKEDATKNMENFGTRPGDTVGLHVCDKNKNVSFFYIPGCAALDAALVKRIKNSSLLLFDGTVYFDDDMERAGVGGKTGKRMGHISMQGEDGSLAICENLNIARKVFVHINNTNPVLIEDSPERAVVQAKNWEVGFDGQEILL